MRTRTHAPNDPHDDVPVRPAQGTRAAVAAIQRAQGLACLVRDEGANGIGAYLDRLDVDQLYAVVVALAAMVPVDQTATQLLGWLEDHDAAEGAA